MAWARHCPSRPSTLISASRWSISCQSSAMPRRSRCSAASRRSDGCWARRTGVAGLQYALDQSGYVGGPAHVRRSAHVLPRRKSRFRTSWCTGDARGEEKFELTRRPEYQGERLFTLSKVVRRIIDPPASIKIASESPRRPKTSWNKRDTASKPEAKVLIGLLIFELFRFSVLLQGASRYNTLILLMYSPPSGPGATTLYSADSVG